VDIYTNIFPIWVFFACFLLICTFSYVCTSSCMASTYIWTFLAYGHKLYAWEFVDLTSACSFSAYTFSFPIWVLSLSTWIYTLSAWIFTLSTWISSLSVQFVYGRWPNGQQQQSKSTGKRE
jgi:hypothetical protein